MRLIRTFMLLAAVAAAVACKENDAIDDGKTEEPDVEKPVDVPSEYTVSTMNIVTEDNAPIVGKNKEHYVNCNVTIDHENKNWDYEGTARIRGRGNSTWLWYDKKPYRIKLDKKAALLGLAEEKDWVLLANYRDPSHVMNTFVFELARIMGTDE